MTTTDPNRQRLDAQIAKAAATVLAEAEHENRAKGGRLRITVAADAWTRLATLVELATAEEDS